MSKENEKELFEMIKALYPIVYIVSHEERRILDAIDKILQSKELLKRDKIAPEMKVWSEDLGICDKDNKVIDNREELKDPVILLDYIKKTDPNKWIIYVLRDFDTFLSNTLIQRYFKTFIQENMINICIIVLTPILNLPQRLIKTIPIIEWALPTYEERESILAMHKNTKKNLYPDSIKKDQIIKSMAGFTEEELTNLLARQTAVDKSEILSIELLNKEKLAIAKKNPVLEIYQPTDFDRFEYLGGWDNAKSFINDRKNCLSEDFIKFGGDPLKGMLLFGIPGCAKSLFCKCLGYEFGLPVIKLSLAAVMAQSGGIVGQSENWLKEAFNTIEAIAPCILFMDEIDKGAAGMESSGQSDAGMTSRTLSILLDKLENRSAQYLIVATANNVKKLPAEMVRPGRWDRLMFAGLPTLTERKQIFNVHLHKRGFKIDDININLLAGMTEDYTGVEIEQIVKDSIIKAFNSNRKKLTTEILSETVSTIIPQSKLRYDSINELVNWAEQNGALNVSNEKSNGSTSVLKIAKPN